MDLLGTTRSGFTNNQLLDLWNAETSSQYSFNTCTGHSEWSKTNDPSQIIKSGIVSGPGSWPRTKEAQQKSPGPEQLQNSRQKGAPKNCAPCYSISQRPKQQEIWYFQSSLPRAQKEHPSSRTKFHFGIFWICKDLSRGKFFSRAAYPEQPKY